MRSHTQTQAAGCGRLKLLASRAVPRLYQAVGRRGPSQCRVRTTCRKRDTCKDVSHQDVEAITQAAAGRTEEPLFGQQGPPPLHHKKNALGLFHVCMGTWHAVAVSQRLCHQAVRISPQTQALPNAAVAYALQAAADETFRSFKADGREVLLGQSVLPALAAVGQMLSLEPADLGETGDSLLGVAGPRLLQTHTGQKCGRTPQHEPLTMNAALVLIVIAHCSYGKLHACCLVTTHASHHHMRGAFLLCTAFFCHAQTGCCS